MNNECKYCELSEKLESFDACDDCYDLLLHLEDLFLDLGYKKTTQVITKMLKEYDSKLNA